MRESSANPCSITSAGACASPPGLGSEVIDTAYSGPRALRATLRGSTCLVCAFEPMETRSGGGRSTATVVGALGLLYMAQGIPFGFATEYLPVVLREQGYSYSAIAAVSWLQLPWQLKMVWAKAADHPRVRPRTRGIVLVLQLW